MTGAPAVSRPRLAAGIDGLAAAREKQPYRLWAPEAHPAPRAPLISDRVLAGRRLIVPIRSDGRLGAARGRARLQIGPLSWSAEGERTDDQPPRNEENPTAEQGFLTSG